MLSRFLIISFSVITLAACQNTVQGFGQDLEKAGQKIQGNQTTKTQATPSAPVYNSAAPAPATQTYNAPTYGDTY
tara:strand:- start:495 stop:719 length:225 start_codon:yes stop_codon:yes gene_type:complete